MNRVTLSLLELLIAAKMVNILNKLGLAVPSSGLDLA